MSILSRFKDSRIGQIWLKYNEKIVLVIGIILIAAVSFEAGYLEGQKNKQASVVVNKTACAPCPENNQTTKASESTASAGTNNPNGSSENQKTEAPTTEPQTCSFVASKNSDKYHLASCQWAARIKPENKICFSSTEEAQKRGYQGAKCCIK